MFTSVIVHKDKFYPSKMLIPTTIGDTMQGYCNRLRLNRMLPNGHRWRGDVE